MSFDRFTYSFFYSSSVNVPGNNYNEINSSNETISSKIISSISNKTNTNSGCEKVLGINIDRELIFNGHA